MKKLLLALAVASTLGTGLFYANKADCIWCNPNPCYNKGNCGQCSCLKSGDDSEGRCVSNNVYDYIMSKKTR